MTHKIKKTLSTLLVMFFLFYGTSMAAPIQIDEIYYDNSANSNSRLLWTLSNNIFAKDSQLFINSRDYIFDCTIRIYFYFLYSSEEIKAVINYIPSDVKIPEYYITKLVIKDLLKFPGRIGLFKGRSGKVKECKLKEQKMKTIKYSYNNISNHYIEYLDNRGLSFLDWNSELWLEDINSNETLSATILLLINEYMALAHEISELDSKSSLLIKKYGNNSLFKEFELKSMRLFKIGTELLTVSKKFFKYVKPVVMQLQVPNNRENARQLLDSYALKIDKLIENTCIKGQDLSRLLKKKNALEKAAFCHEKTNKSSESIIREISNALDELKIP